MTIPRLGFLLLMQAHVISNQRVRLRQTTAPKSIVEVASPETRAFSVLRWPYNIFSSWIVMNCNSTDEQSHCKIFDNTMFIHVRHRSESRTPGHYFSFTFTASVVPNAVLWPILAQVWKQSAGEHIKPMVRACLSLFSCHLLEFI